VRREEAKQRWVCLSACDPANLLGSVLAGERVPRVPGNRVLYLDGVPVATWIADKFAALPGLPPDMASRAQAQLAARPAPRMASPALH